ncbi:MAG: hypothetical protein ABIQ35_14955 [Verrucomicrobiota bacterium]
MPRKILVVDERPLMLRLIQHHLERAGYELIKAHNRVEAMKAIDRQAPELVVMNDHFDPQPQSSRSSPHIPVIRMPDLPGEKAESDGDVVFTKPFSPTHLVAEVKRLVSGS